MKRAKSDYSMGLGGPFTQLLQDKVSAQAAVGTNALLVAPQYAVVNQGTGEDNNTPVGKLMSFKFDELSRNQTQPFILSAAGLMPHSKSF